MVLRSSRQSIPRFPEETRADLAFKSILQSLFKIIQNNEARILKHGSPLSIHAFRVAIRRSRSLLAYSHGILPESRIHAARKNLAWLMSHSNDIRDRQVMLEKLKGLDGELPASCGKPLRDFRNLLEKQIQHELKHLQKQLGSKRYQAFKVSWAAYLDSAPPARSSLPYAAEPLRHVSAMLINTAWRKVLDKGMPIRLDSPAEDIHKLRIVCKRFRYCLEFFADASILEQELLALENLQDSLGELQDLVVHHGLLQDARLKLGAETQSCLQSLELLLDEREPLLRRVAIKAFHDFRQSWRHAL